MKLIYQAAVIFVEDIGRSRRFYEEVMGQTVMADHGENIVFTAGFSIWQAERAGTIIFGAGVERARTGSENLELYFECDDLEEALGRLSDAGAPIIQQVHAEPWGQLTFRCYDPDGHLVEVGEPMSQTVRRLSLAGYTPEELVARTSMPMEFVLQAIGHPRFC